MKRVFLIKVVLFLIPLFALVVGIETFVRSIPNSYSYKKQWMEDHKDAVETIILGNSHMYAAIDASLMKNAFNLSNSAQSLEMDCWLLSEYVKKCKNLKTIFINVDNMNLFSSDYESSGKVWNRAIYYNLYMGYPKHGVLSRYHYEVSCPLFTCKKIERYVYSVIRGFHFDIQCDSLGRGTYYGNKNRKERDFCLNKNYFFSEKSSKKIDACRRNLENLSRMASACQRNKIRLIIISTPYWSLYNKHLSMEDIAMIRETINIIRKRHNIEYGDFRQDTRLSRNSQYFVDRSHLSDKGSYYFTQLIKKKYCIQ